VADFTIRPARPDDTDAVYSLFADWQVEAYGEVEMGPEMFAAGLDSADGSFVAETDAGIVGHSGVRGNGIDVGVAPAWRRRRIGTALLHSAEGAATEDPLLLVGVAGQPWAPPFAIVNGYEKKWEVWLMGIDLPEEIPGAHWPEGVAVRTFREEDAHEVKDLLDLAYEDELHHHPLTFEQWRHFMLDDPMYDPDAWFLALAGDRIVGAALNWDEGYVKDLVVHPDWRGRGLGKALMLETFGEFSRRGIPRVTLKTDSNNPTDAWRLYERVGMKIERTYEVFEKRRS
jgi:ribosomal protein S18 acetylase RimI-like enzyme